MLRQRMDQNRNNSSRKKLNLRYSRRRILLRQRIRTGTTARKKAKLKIVKETHNAYARIRIQRQLASHPTVGVAGFAPKRPWAIEFLM